MRVAFLSVQALDGFANTTDNVRGRLPALIRDAGFTDVRGLGREETFFGTLAFYQAGVVEAVGGGEFSSTVANRT